MTCFGDHASGLLRGRVLSYGLKDQTFHITLQEVVNHGRCTGFVDVIPAVVGLDLLLGFLTGFQLQPISETNKLPSACNRKEAAQKKAVKVTLLDHEVIMEEAGKRDRLEYDVDNDDDSDESKEESAEESKEESKE